MKQFAMDQLVESNDESKRKPRISYTRKFLLYLSEKHVCKKLPILPSEFDEALLLGPEDPSPERVRYSGDFSSHGFRWNDYSSSPLVRARWERRSGGWNDKDSDSQSERDSESIFIKNQRSMGKQFDKKKITWTIKNFSSLPDEPIFSDEFVVGGCKWKLNAYPKGNDKAKFLSLFLDVAGRTSLPSGWRILTKYRLTILNQVSCKPSDSYLIEREKWFDENDYGWGRRSMCPLNVINANDSGLLLNGELKIVAEIEVLETIGKLDVTEETSTLTETVDVNGFHLLPSQAQSVSRLFERHPEIASDFRPKRTNLKTGYMSLLLSLIETMIQFPQEMSKDDLDDAHVALRSLRDAGFKLDWLEKKLNELSEKSVRTWKMEEELKDMKQKCADMEALVEKEKAEMTVSKAHISFDDIV